MSDTGTSAPHQHMPEIVEAPRSSNVEWVRDNRPSAAPDQVYPQIVPAVRVPEKKCPTCGKYY
jgi:hypothetical protein